MAKAVYNLDLGGGIIKHTHPEVTTLENDYVSLTIDQSINSNKIFTENVTVQGIFSATSAIILNSNLSGVPSDDAYVVVNRGTSTDSVLKWNETLDQWEAGLSGDTYAIALEDTEVDFSIVNVGDSITASNSTRTFNIADTNGVVRILSIGLDPSLEFLHRDTADGADNAYWDIGADDNDYFYIRKRTGGPTLSALTVDNDLNVKLYGNLIVDYSETNYTAHTQTLTGHLNGIDNELGALSGVVSSLTTESIKRTYTLSGHSFATQDVVMFDSVTSEWNKAIANSAANAEALGIVESVQSDDFTVVYAGAIDTLSGLVPAQTYFLSTSVSGALTLTEPTSAGHVSKPMLRSISDTEGIVYSYRGMLLSDEPEESLGHISRIETGETRAIASGYQLLHKGKFKNDGELILNGELVIF